MFCLLFQNTTVPGHDFSQRGRGRGAGGVYIFIIRLWLHSAHLHSINITILCSFVALRHAGPPPPLRETNEMIHKLLVALSRGLMALIVDVMEILGFGVKTKSGSRLFLVNSDFL